MKFVYITTDGKKHEKEIPNGAEHQEERLDFITWLETSPEVIKWR